MTLCFIEAAEAVGLRGRVLEYTTGKPIEGVNIDLDVAHGVISSSADGYFEFTSLSPGYYAFTATHLGYKSIRDSILVEHESTSFEILMHPRALLVDTILVVGDTLQAMINQPSQIVSGTQLRSQMRGTLAQTLANQSGMAQRSLGSAPSRPVVRGLGNARLLVLEDGQRTGDLSASSPDHAVVIEPLAAQRIELVHGPETVLYGSSALAGLINSVRNLIPSTRPDRWKGTIIGQLESSPANGATNARLGGAAGLFALHADISGRRTGNIRTPIGSLLNTDAEVRNIALGIAGITTKGRLGTALSHYTSEYGIPPDPVAGHPQGVRIAMNRQRIEWRVDIPRRRDHHGHLEWYHSATRYYHAEYEAADILGTEFGIITHNGGLRILGKNRVFGAWYEHRDYASAGLNFTPNTSEYAGALYLYRSLERPQWRFQAAVRWDTRTVEPESFRTSPTIGRIRLRRFNGFSGGASVQYLQSEQWNITLTWMRSFRAPGVEELFSEGPHLAAYAYEIGNSELKAEYGSGLELSTTWQGKSLELRLALFKNQYHNYLLAQHTGSTSSRRADLPLYQIIGRQARFQGAEGMYSLPLGNHLQFFGMASYVQGTLTRANQAIPQMPPLQGHVGLRWSIEQLKIQVQVRGVAKQKRLALFEQATDGYWVSDITAQYSHFWQDKLHAIVFAVDNATNTVYRNHLNRVKDLMPEPGRNLRLLYQVYF